MRRRPAKSTVEANTTQQQQIIGHDKVEGQQSQQTPQAKSSATFLSLPIEVRAIIYIYAVEVDYIIDHERLSTYLAKPFRHIAPLPDILKLSEDVRAGLFHDSLKANPVYIQAASFHRITTMAFEKKRKLPDSDGGMLAIRHGVIQYSGGRSVLENYLKDALRCKNIRKITFICRCIGPTVCKISPVHRKLIEKLLSSRRLKQIVFLPCEIAAYPGVQGKLAESFYRAFVKIGAEIESKVDIVLQPESARSRPQDDGYLWTLPN